MILRTGAGNDTVTAFSGVYNDDIRTGDGDDTINVSRGKDYIEAGNGTDTLYEKSNYRLPLSLDCGDRVELLATGAYVTTYASQAFNGFRPLAEHYV